jgi:error-prone DNA polymerase
MQFQQEDHRVIDATMIGLDLAKQVFQFHGVDAGGEKLFKRRLQRSEVRSFSTEFQCS